MPLIGAMSDHTADERDVHPLPAHLVGGGRMAEAIARFDWAATPLGPVDGWPQSLRTAVSMALNSRFPTFMTWGEAFTCLYNDAYMPLLGEKAQALGRPFPEVWGEAWPVLGPLAAKAMAGEATYHQNLPVTLYRHGYPEPTWFTFSYSPIRDEAGGVGGVLGVIYETTAEIHATSALQASETRLRLALEAGRMAVFEHRTADDSIVATPELKRMLGWPAEATLTTADLRTRYFPGAREHLTAVAEEALRRGDRFFEAEFRFFVGQEARWFLLRAEMLFDGGPLPTSTIGVLMDITERKQAEIALREREAELSAALEAGSLAPFDFDHVAGVFRPSPRLNQLYGFGPDHTLTLDDIRSRYHPDDVARIYAQRDADAAATSKRRFDWTMRVRLPDGDLRWLNGLGEYIRDDDGRIVRSRGITMDVTDRKRMEERQRLLINELNHRVKNTLATIQSLALQSFRGLAGEAVGRLAAFEARLISLSRAHDVLTMENWQGADMAAVVRAALAGFVGPDDDGRVRLGGPRLALDPRTALALALALHELATNATKYGSLSVPEGRLNLVWSAAEGRFLLQWIESDGPVVRLPTRTGFGTRLLQRHLSSDLAARVEIDFKPKGLRCTIDAPLENAPS